MSQENVTALRRMYEGWAAGDMSAGASLFDPYVVYVPQTTDTDPGPHYGLEAANAYMRHFLANWDDWRIAAEGFRAAGDSVLVNVRRSGIGKGSGAPVGDQAVQVWTFRGGKVIRLDVFQHETEALEAVGLSENQDAHADF
jgi:ketosteroid isomerase-like protein